MYQSFDHWSFGQCEKFYEMRFVFIFKADMAQNMPKNFHYKIQHQIYSNLIISVEEPHIHMHQPRIYGKDKIYPCV
jgi:hypothetical protein